MELDPLPRASAFQVDALLMIHGEHDDMVPLDGHRRLYDALTPQYADRPEDALFLTHARGHATPEQLELFAWDWLIDRVGDDLNIATEAMLEALDTKPPPEVLRRIEEQ